MRTLTSGSSCSSRAAGLVPRHMSTSLTQHTDGMVQRSRRRRGSRGVAYRRAPVLPAAVHCLLFMLLLSFVAVVRAFDVHDRQLRHACVSCSRSFSVLGALQRHYRRDHPGVVFWEVPGGQRTQAAPAAVAAISRAAQPPHASSTEAPDQGGREAAPEQCEPALSQPTAVAGMIQQYYRDFDDMATVRPIVEQVEGGRPQRFNTPTLRMFRSFAVSVGGSGLSGSDRELFWENIVAAEREALRGTSASECLGPMEAAFSSAHKFKASLRTDADQCMQDLKWMVADIKTASQTVPFYFRDLLGVLVNAAQQATCIKLRGERRWDADGNVVRSGTLDSDVYLAEQDDVLSDARHSGIDKKFVMGVQLFSDSALVSWSGGA